MIKIFPILSATVEAHRRGGLPVLVQQNQELLTPQRDGMRHLEAVVARSIPLSTQSPLPVFELSITPLTNFPMLWSTARLNAATNKKVLAKPCASTSGETSPSAEGKETWKAKLVPFQERACLFPKSVSLRGEKNKSPTQD